MEAQLVVTHASEEQLEFGFIANEKTVYLSVNNEIYRVGSLVDIGTRATRHPGSLVVGKVYRDENKWPIVYEGVVDGKYSFIRQGFDFEKIRVERAKGIHHFKSINTVLLTDLISLKDYEPNSEEYSNAKSLLINLGQWKEKPKARRKKIKV